MSTSLHNLAFLILSRKWDLIRAEKLERESIRIRILLFGNDNAKLGETYDILGQILQAQGNFGEETLTSFKYALAIPLRNEGPYGLNTAMGNSNLAGFYYEFAGMQLTIDSKRAQLLLAKSHYEVSLRFYLERLGPTHDETIFATSSVEDVTRKLRCTCPIGMCDFSTKRRS
jgi:tetratricopeptide (TPR) repeat protein